MGCIVKLAAVEHRDGALKMSMGTYVGVRITMVAAPDPNHAYHIINRTATSFHQ